MLDFNERYTNRNGERAGKCIWKACLIVKQDACRINRLPSNFFLFLFTFNLITVCILEEYTDMLNKRSPLIIFELRFICKVSLQRQFQMLFEINNLPLRYTGCSIKNEIICPNPFKMNTFIKTGKRTLPKGLLTYFVWASPH